MMLDTVATTYMTAFGAAPQVQPPSTARNTLDTPIAAWFCGRIDSPDTAVQFDRAFDERDDGLEILGQLVRQAVAMDDVFGVIVGRPHLPVCGLPYEDLERQIEPRGRSSQHQGQQPCS